MTKTAKPFWIKRRSNPQVGVYYVAMGQMSKTKARSHAKTLYGNNEMLEFSTREEYQAEIQRIKERNDNLQGV